MTVTGRVHGILLVAVLFGCIASSVERGEAHKPITSKYTYNDDVFPILRDRCGRCHVPDGVAPMSLMTHKDAFPWGESLRAELISGHMPPWSAQAGAIRFKNAPAITAIEIDKILMWATGSTPQGNPQHVPPPVTIQHDWSMGKPDLMLELPNTTLAVDNSETTREFTVPTKTTAPKWVSAVNLLPGTPAIVRDAIISVKTNTTAEATTSAPERVLALWVPGEDPVAADDAAFQLPAGAELVVRVHYLKTYTNEGKEMTDRSAVGLYFAEGSSREIQRLTVASTPVTATSPASVSFSETLNADLQALAFRPDPALSNVNLKVDAVSPSGIRTAVLRMAARPNWTRRYWFEQPLALPRGTRIEVVALINGADPLLPPAGTPLPPQVIDGSPLRVVFDVVPMAGTRTAH
jgi:hypothetical protein